MRLVLIGGGGFRTPLIFRALLDRRADVAVDELVLYDVDAARLARIRSVLDAMVRQAGGSAPAIRTGTDLDDAVRGADVVFAAVRVGGAAGRSADERRALDLGVLGQETVGAGGLSFGLRTLPVMLALARRVAELAPQAWLLNFTNPAGMITEALQEVLGHRVIGICDSPIGLVRRTCRALGVDAARAEADYVGINHLGWLRSLTVDGHDLLPGLLADTDALGSFEEGRLFGPQLPRMLGAIPNEYLYFYYAHRDLITELRSGTTRGEVVAADQRAFYAAPGPGVPGADPDVDTDPAAALAAWTEARMRREHSYLAEARTSDRDVEDLSGGGYEHVAMDLMAALSGGRARTVIANGRNGSAVPQLPADMVLELPSTVDSGGLTPLAVPRRLTLHQLGLIASVRASERTLIDAVNSRSLELAQAAFALHPLVGSPRIAAELLRGTLADHPGLGAVFDATG